MSTVRIRFWCSAMLLALIPACGSKDVLTPTEVFRTRAIPAEIKPAADAVVAANNHFAFDLYAQLRTQDGNLFFSPFSISTAFAMTYAGAAGATQQEMSSVFHFPAETAQFHSAYQALLESLDRGQALGGYTLSTANRLWPQRDYAFLQSYMDVTRLNYKAPAQPLDYVADAEGARGVINDWVAAQTRNKILNLMPPGSVTRDTRLVLTNAIYFKGLWAVQFDPAATRQAAFQVDAARSVNVPMMSREDTVRFAQVDSVSIVEKTYRGGDLSMIAVLPWSITGLARVEQNLSAITLDGWRARLRSARIMVALPRFSFTSKFGLVPTLSSMGMPSAFDASLADFSGMDGRRDLVINAVIHQAYVSVNEEGTEAAAATGIGVGATSMPPSFVANHPFFFAIRDNVTGSYLFLGRVVNPAE